MQGTITQVTSIAQFERVHIWMCRCMLCSLPLLKTHDSHGQLADQVTSELAA